MDLSSWFRRSLLSTDKETKNPDLQKHFPNQDQQSKQQQEEELLGLTDKFIDFLRTFTLETFKNFPLPGILIPSVQHSKTKTFRFQFSSSFIFAIDFLFFFTSFSLQPNGCEFVFWFLIFSLLLIRCSCWGRYTWWWFSNDFRQCSEGPHGMARATCYGCPLESEGYIIIFRIDFMLFVIDLNWGSSVGESWPMGWII